MSEYREALQKLSDAVEDTMREHYKELGCCSVTRARLDEAKELLARPHIDWEGRYRFLIENRGSVEPAAAEKAREPAIIPCSDQPLFKFSINGRGEIKGELVPSPPAATGEKP